MKTNKLFSKLFDYGFCYLWVLLLSLTLPSSWVESLSPSLLALFIPLLWIVPEACFLHFWGKTPGKFLFGLSLSGKEGKKPSWKDSFLESIPLFFSRQTLEKQPLSPFRFLAVATLALGCGSVLFFGQDISDAAVEYEGHQISEGGWKSYSLEEGSFTVNFPNKPAVETKSFPIPNSKESLDMEEFTAEKREAEYAVSCLELPKKWTIFSDGTLLKGAFKVIVEHLKGAEVVSTRRVTHETFQALEFQIKHEGQEIYGKLLIAGGSLYKLTVAYPLSHEGEKLHQNFLSSFAIKK